MAPAYIVNVRIGLPSCYKAEHGSREAASHVVQKGAVFVVVDHVVRVNDTLVV